MGEIFEAIKENIELVHIILFALGIIFLVAEMFEPGVGVLGAIGAVLMIIDVFVLAESFAQGLVLFTCVIFIILLAVLIMFILASYGIVPKKLVLKDTQITSESFAAPPDVKEGEEGITVTYLRPVGKADFGGKVYDVISEGEYIEKDKTVEVVTVSGSKITVREK